MVAIHRHHHMIATIIPIHSIMAVHMALRQVLLPKVLDIMHRVLLPVVAMHRDCTDLRQVPPLMRATHLVRREECKGVQLNTDPLGRQAAIALLNTALQAGFHISIVDR